MNHDFTADPELDRELELASACCRDLLKIYENTKDAVSSNAPAETLYKCMEQMQAADRKSAQCAERISALAEQTGCDPENHPGFAKWQKVLAQTLEQNRRIKQFVQASLVVSRDEIERLHTGRQALCGYHSKGRARTRITGARIDCGA